MREEALAALLYGSGDNPFGFDAGEVAEASALVHKMVWSRSHRGTGTVADWFPQTIESWRAQHPGRDLAAAFCGSVACAAWPEISLEEAWYRHFDGDGAGDPDVREEELLGAVVRALAVAPRAQFRWPEQVKAAPGGCYAVTRKLVLHAALDGRYLRGEVTELIAQVLRGESSDEQVRRQLQAMRLVD